MKTKIYGRVFCMCDVFVDQGRYIGDDPVGHKCTNRATKQFNVNGQEMHICDECLVMWQSNPKRLSFYGDAIANPPAGLRSSEFVAKALGFDNPQDFTPGDLLEAVEQDPRFRKV